MTVSLKHAFTSAKVDGTDSTLIQPSNWNSEHTLTLAAGKVLGRDSSGAGAAQELAISVDSTQQSMIPPSGTTAQRPASPSAGMMRYNSTTGKFEGYTTAWGTLGGGCVVSDTAPVSPQPGDLWWNSSDGQMYVYYDDGTSLQWVIGNYFAGMSTFLPLTGGTLTGNLGIGVTPSVPLDVSTSISRIANFNSTSAQGPGIRFTRSGTINGYIGSAAYIVSGGAIADFGIDVSGANNLIFGTNDTERMRVDSVGNVGIGNTPTASYKLNVAGNVLLDNTYSVSWKNSSGTALGLIGLNASNNLEYGQSGAFTGTHAWFSGGSERMRISTAGELLVGTTTSGSSRVTADTLNSYAFSARINLNGEVGFQGLYVPATGTAYYGYWKYNGTVVGSITSSGSTTTYGTTSDYRVKEDFKPISDPVSRLLLLQPKNFAWKSNGTRSDGFVAHEVQPVVPDAVVGEKDAVAPDGEPMLQSIDPSKLVPLLTAALQEALRTIDDLKARVAVLEAK